LAAYLSGARVPPLITASRPGTPRATAGVLGASGTRVLFGDESLGDAFRSGIRARLGGWLDDDREIGFEVSGLVLSDWSQSFTAGSADGSAIVSRPFFDAHSGRANAELVSFPGVLAGVVAADPATSHFYATDVVCRKSICRDGCSYFDAVAGYRYMQFGDSVRMTEQLQPLVAGVPTGEINLVDEFGAGNHFNGGVIGVAAGWSNSNFSVDLQARLGIGATSRIVSIVGATQIASPGAATLNSVGGLLALPSNIGTYQSSDWSVVPDVDLKVGYQLTECARLTFGYSALYWTGVARAAEQIDLAVNPTQLPPGTLIGPARPEFSLTRSNLLVQSFSVGIELRY
jgi:Putative beta barrel porin-7 (BBP7)